MSVASFTALTNPGYGKVLTGTVSVAAGDMIVLFGTYCSNQSWASGSDDDGNTYAETAHSSESELAAYIATASSSNAALSVTLTMNTSRSSKSGFCIVISGGGAHVSTEEASNASGPSHSMGSVSLASSGVVITGSRNSGSANLTDGSSGWDDSNGGAYFLSFRGYDERSTAKSGEAFTVSPDRSSEILSIGIEYAGGGAVTFAVSDNVNQSAVDSLPIAQTHSIAVSEAVSKTASAGLVATQRHFISVTDVEAATSADSVGATTTTTFGVHEIVVATALNQLSIGQAQAVGIGEPECPTLLNGIDVSQHHDIDATDLETATSIDSVLITIEGVVSFSVLPVVSASSTDLSGILQAHVVETDDVIGPTSIDTIGLAQLHAIGFDIVQVATSVDSAALGRTLVAALFYASIVGAETATTLSRSSTAAILGAAVLGVGNMTTERVVGDTGTAIAAILQRDWGAIDLAAYDAVEFRLVADSGTVKVDWTAAEFDDKASGKVKYSPNATDVDTAGRFWAWFRVSDDGGTTWETFPTAGRDGKARSFKVVFNDAA